MADIALIWDALAGGADFSIAANDLEQDAGLETAVLLSLALDRRAEAGDVLPLGEVDRRGWWADDFPAAPGDRIGSRLWLLAREKQQPIVLSRAKDYAAEALAWLTEDKVASRVDVAASILGNGVLGLAITIYRPTVDAMSYKFNYTWAAQELRRAE